MWIRNVIVSRSDCAISKTQDSYYNPNDSSGLIIYVHCLNSDVLHQQKLVARIFKSELIFVRAICEGPYVESRPSRQTG
jgi:hypothetical protein